MATNVDEILNNFWVRACDDPSLCESFNELLQEKEMLVKVINFNGLFYNFIALLKANDINKLDIIRECIFNYIKFSPMVELKILERIVKDNSINKDTISWLIDKTGLRLNLKYIKGTEYIKGYEKFIWYGYPQKFILEDVSKNSKNEAIAELSRSSTANGNVPVTSNFIRVCNNKPIPPLRMKALRELPFKPKTVNSRENDLPKHISSEITELQENLKYLTELQENLKYFISARTSAVKICSKYITISYNLRIKRFFVGMASLAMSFVFGLIPAYENEHIEWSLPLFYTCLATFVFVISGIPFFLSDRYLVRQKLKNEAQKHDEDYPLADCYGNDLKLMDYSCIDSYIPQINTCIFALLNVDKLHTNPKLLPYKKK